MTSRKLYTSSVGLVAIFGWNKEMKRPTPSELDYNLKIDEHDCKNNNIDFVLKDLKVKHWCDAEKLAKRCLKNKALPLDSDSAIRMILNFFKKTNDAYQSNYALSEYAKRCRIYWSNNENKALLKRHIQDEIRSKQFDLEITRSKNEKYNLRRAAKAKKEATEANISYQSALFVHAAVQNRVLEEERRISTLSESSNETVDHDDCCENRGKKEDDNIFTSENQATSIATRIKNAAESVHKKYVDGVPLSENEICVMSLGLSSILNTDNNSEHSQKSIFSEKEWSDLSAYYKQKYQIATCSLPEDACHNVWKTAVNVVNEKGLFYGMKYIAKIQSLPKTSEKSYKYLSIYHHVLKILNNERPLIDAILGKTTIQISELDVFDIWSPIFKDLININGLLRFKKGETVNGYSTNNKRQQYPETNGIMGFRIDFRILYDRNGTEMDLAAGELAINSRCENKVIHDQSKLLREAKDITDSHHSSYLNNNFGWAIQIAGLEGSCSTVNLDRNGLYVGTPQLEIEFPKDERELHKLDNTLTVLHTLIMDLEKQARRMMCQSNAVKESASSSLSEIFNREKPSEADVNSLKHYQRPTYYTPPQKERTKSVIPKALYGKMCLKRKNTVEDTVIIGFSNRQKKKKRHNADEFGWYKDDDVWHNECSGETSESNPYE
ncbi:hypothetical protein EC973_002994 [Apophysomyces ossiformis]|uniref:Uncharacterized protein n=1 Tax=Apophysomyces ossiformis TaxID=679940 RepID=A0A8H7ERS5_9FUNG|nr:hypothetical protein EC973_002994 [Apophysomyces ossiformis]